ncbi:hypothetical protein [Cellulomonas sp.]|uniref:hypothetical protein n=1 Tax=Cellulomonas sp. TaxID=40001 RepID=UPI00258C9C9C|nr:hypothetical protein [Cellulomonas sp.]MCR6688580.1 hypothetical protein [Cellulomonas sp.]
MGAQEVELGWVRCFYMEGYPAPGGPRVEGDSWELVVMPTENSYVLMQSVYDPEDP